MGKTKIKTIDDSVKEEAVKRPKKKAAEKVAARGEKLDVGSSPRFAGEAGEKEKIVILGSEATPESKKEDSGQARLVFDESERARMTDKRPQKPGKSKPRSKKYQEASKDLDRSKSYPIDDAVDMVKKLSYSKFNATIEAHVNTVQTGLRGILQLPYASGKKLRILAFPPARLSPQDKKELENEGLVFGDEKTLEDISKGKFDFDLIITAPEWMVKIAKVARVLGPKGLMPNPENGTIADEIKKAFESFQGGKTEYKTESKAPVIHMAMGKMDQPNEELAANIKVLLSTLGKSKIKKVSLSPTMGPSVKLDLSTI